MSVLRGKSLPQQNEHTLTHPKAKFQAKHYINSVARQTVERLYHLGVKRIVVGYPKEIARNSERGRRQNFILSQVWRFNYVIKRLKEVAEEYGTQVVLVDEAFTSQLCPPLWEAP